MKNWLITHKMALIYCFIALILIVTAITLPVVLIKNKKPAPTTTEYTMVEFGGENCIFCEKFKPIFNSLKSKYGKKINFVYCDIEGSEEEIAYSKKFNIKFKPTLVFLKSDTELKRLYNNLTEDLVVSTFKELGWI